jgi:hypothetical protein
MITIRKTKHISKRQRQRGLREDVLELILDFGEVKYGAGAVWYCLRQRLLPSYLKGTEIAKMAESWVVVATEDTAFIMTAYARKNPNRHIRLKCRQKTLTCGRSRLLYRRENVK